MLLNEVIQLNEAKSIIDVRHEDEEKTYKYFGSEKKAQFIAPKDGFYFIYYDGHLLLHSTNNEVYDFRVATKLYDAKKEKYSAEQKEMDRQIGRMWNQLGGRVDFTNDTITFTKESVRDTTRTRITSDIQLIQKVFKELMKFKVTGEFKIKGLQPTLNKKVKEVLAMKDVVDELSSSNDVAHMKFYHGTTKAKWEEFIKTKGLIPGKYGDAYNDLIPRYSEHNVYLATQPKTAEFYGKRQAKKDNVEGYVVLEITGLDIGKFRPDDYFAPRDRTKTVKDHGYDKAVVDDSDMSRMFASAKAGVRELDSIAYKGRILPTKIKIYKEYK